MRLQSDDVVPYESGMNERQRTCSLSRHDAVEWLRQFPSESADLIITDPPYQSLEKYRAIGTTTRLKKSKASSNDWFAVYPNARFPELLSELFRVLRKNSHFYLFCDPETMFVVKPLAEAAGFRFWKPLVWDKQSIGMGYHYRGRYEFILFFEKGKRRLSDLALPDVLSFKRIFGGYPAEKPHDLIATLIKQSSAPGEFVLDPFFGSGSTIVASLTLDRLAAGTDISDFAHETARTRLSTLGCMDVSIEHLLTMPRVRDTASRRRRLTR